MALVQIKELVMIQLEPVFVSKDLREFLEYAKVCIYYFLFSSVFKTKL